MRALQEQHKQRHWEEKGPVFIGGWFLVQSAQSTECVKGIIRKLDRQIDLRIDLSIRGKYLPGRMNLNILEKPRMWSDTEASRLLVGFCR